MIPGLPLGTDAEMTTLTDMIATATPIATDDARLGDGGARADPAAIPKIDLTGSRLLVGVNFVTPDG